MNNYIDTSVITLRDYKRESLYQILSYQLRGMISVIMLTLNTLFWFNPLIIITFLKLLIPIKGWRKLCSKILKEIAFTWISVNNFNLKITRSIKWDIKGMENLSTKQWYLVISNHQTWADIVVLQKVFIRRIPFLKFFLKKELIWVPLLGLAWWALDFPFMKRYSAAFLKKFPHLKGKDIEITRNACKKFQTMPVSIMNFVEGTRFTEEKHNKQRSPFKNLLKPRAGGIGFVLSTMGDQLKSILNVTIIYPDGRKSFWGFLCGRIKTVKIIVEEIPITEDILGDYVDDKEYQVRFQNWLNSLWSEKDKMFD